MKQPHILAFSGALLSLALVAHSQTVHDGAGKWPLTASMVHSGLDAKHVNVYQNYLVRSQLSLVNLSNVTITQCDVGGWSASSDGIFVNTVNNVWIINNTFHDLPNCTGIGALPTHITDCHFDGNTFTNILEPIHLDFGTDGFCHDNSVSYNNLKDFGRWGIELQGISSSGLKVMNNYMTTSTNTNAGGISNATGGSAEATAAGHFSVGTEIGYNVILGVGGPPGAIENSGSASNVHDNYMKNWGMGVFYTNTNLDGMNRPWHVTNNIFIGVGQGQINYEGSSQPGQYPPPVTTPANQVYALNDPKAPPVPTVAATVSGATTQPTTKASAAQPAVPPFTAEAQVDGVHVSNLPGSAGTLTWTADGNTGVPFANPTAGQTGNVSVPAGATTAVIASIPNNWEAVLTFSPAVSPSNPGLPGASVIVRANTAQQFPAVNSPAVSPSNPPAAVRIGHSRDGVTWTVDATVQP